jgi:LPXTG-site transpeptidase (sortase) family protein
VGDERQEAHNWRQGEWRVARRSPVSDHRDTGPADDDTLRGVRAVQRDLRDRLGDLSLAIARDTHAWDGDGGIPLGMLTSRHVVPSVRTEPDDWQLEGPPSGGALPSPVHIVDGGTPPRLAMRPESETDGPERTDTPPETSQLAPTLAGARAVLLCLVGLVVYTVFGTAVLQGHRQSALNRLSHLRLSVVDIGLDQWVVDGTDGQHLATGPGVLRGSGLPGGTAPILIVGHRIAEGGPFRNLAAIRPGRAILLGEGSREPLTYVVERVVKVPSSGAISEPSGPQILVLETSSPAYLPRGAVAVVARLSGGVADPQPIAVRLLPDRLAPAPFLAAAMLLAFVGVGWAWRTRMRPAMTVAVAITTRVAAAALGFGVWQLMLRGAPPLL